jgi:hypothetical protein
MASKTATKNARIGAPKARAVPQADVERLISLSGGNFAYVVMPNGTSPHLKTNSEEFAETIRGLASLGYGPRISSQIEHLCATSPNSAWPSVKTFLNANEVFSVSE